MIYTRCCMSFLIAYNTKIKPFKIGFIGCYKPFLNGLNINLKLYIK